MSEPKKVKFAVDPVPPTTIEVVAHDGNTYILETTLVIAEVTDLMRKTNDLPDFQVKAQLLTNVRRK